jgi:hypothetical protein
MLDLLGGGLMRDLSPLMVLLFCGGAMLVLVTAALFVLFVFRIRLSVISTFASTFFEYLFPKDTTKEDKEGEQTHLQRKAAIRSHAARLRSRIAAIDFNALVSRYFRTPKSQQPIITETDRTLNTPITAGGDGKSEYGVRYADHSPNRVIRHKRHERVKGPDSPGVVPTEVRDFDNDGEADV